MSRDASETPGLPAVVDADRSVQAARVSDASAALRSQATALRSALHSALELQAVTVRENDFERVAAGLRDRQRVVVERMLDCLRTEEQLTERVLECLGGLEATRRELLERMKLLESRLESLARHIEQPGPAAARDAGDAGAAPSAVEASDARSGVAPARSDSAAGSVSSSASPGRRPGGRWRRRWRASRCCAVCRSDALGRSKRELTGAGWMIAGETSICTDCRSAGWALNEAGGLPFRQRAAGTG